MALIAHCICNTKNKSYFAAQSKSIYGNDDDNGIILQRAGMSFPDIRIPAHRHTLLLGDSGRGKTTLLHLLSGLSRPDTGKVTLAGRDLYALRGAKLDAFRSQNMGFIFQEPHLLKNLTVMENIKLAQSLAGNRPDGTEIAKLLRYLQLEDKASVLPHRLSRGQKQRAAIARAVVNKPGLLLADEPTASLDDTNTDLVLQLLLDVAGNYGSTLLIATHDKRIKDHFEHSYRL